VRLPKRPVTVLVPICIPVLSTLWYADAARAAVAQHGGHQSLPLPSWESLASLAHGAAQGVAAFLAGLVVFTTLVWLPVSRAENAEGEKTVGLFCRWTWVLAGLLVVTGLVELPVYALRASGESLSPGLLAEALYDTRVGQLWVIRVFLSFLVAAAATYAVRRRSPAYWWGAACIAAVMLMTLTRQSHAAAEEGLLPLAADWLHVVAASVWMGGLLGFPILLIRPPLAMPVDARATLLGRIVRRFSKVATAAVMTLLITGSYAILLHVPSLSALTGTTYGNALIVKLGLLVVLLAAGAVNLVSRGRGPFGRVVRLELALAICVFVATGFLTTLPPSDAEQPTVGDSAGLPAASALRSP
jgi:copper transport protein